MDGTEGQNARWTRSEGGERQARAKMMSPRDWIRTNPKPETGAGRARVASRGGVGRARVGGRARGRSDAMGGRRRGGRERGMVARGGTPARRPGRHPGGVPALGDKRLVAMETSRAAPETRDATEETSSGGGRTARTGSLGLRGDTLICGSLGRRLGGLLSLGADDEALRAVGAGEERLAGDGLAANVRLDGHLRGRRLGRSLKRHAGEGLGAGSHGRHRVDTSASSSERSSRCGARPARRPSLTRKTKTPNLRG